MKSKWIKVYIFIGMILLMWIIGMLSGAPFFSLLLPIFLIIFSFIFLLVPRISKEKLKYEKLIYTITLIIGIGYSYFMSNLDNKIDSNVPEYTSYNFGDDCIMKLKDSTKLHSVFVFKGVDSINLHREYKVFIDTSFYKYFTYDKDSNKVYGISLK